MGKTEEIRSRYILSALEDHCLNGDAYVPSVQMGD